jgi:Fe2+ transport system protein FeoA
MPFGQRFRHHLPHYLLARRRRHRRNRPLSLVDVAPGTTTQVIGFFPGLPPERYAQLRAYGIASGSSVKIIQHEPVTIIQVEFTELALEADIARGVQVAITEPHPEQRL